MDPVIITVASKADPKPGGKQGKVVDTAGNSWQVWQDKLALYHIGGSYRIDNYKTNNFNGRTLNVIDRMTPVGAHIPGALTRTQSAGSIPIPSLISKDETPKRIFVCGALNACLNNQSFNPDSLTKGYLIAMTNMFIEVYEETFGRQYPIPSKIESGKVVHDDMEDEIPDFK